ncbi:TonB-dependent receptor [Phenylobacterium sp. LjRoot225]|uniref:TonB-dependent receptor n=1 Tax=Phenylobacterium sp. LjRoot225 TaxID=3342285 RepID=UPI003ECEEE57
MALAPQAYGQTTGVSATADSSMEIVVTARRREESLRKVPLKVDAYDPMQMDRRGIRSIEDITRFTPGLEFTRTGGVSGDVSTSISIRGIASEVGSATTAIYIDETPIQTRNIGYFGGNPYPRIFDLERVEVLKGPQGTLFGASAEGGAVRFITPQPTLDRISSYARAELSSTENGAPSYEAGAAVGGPIVKDVVGFRLSAWTRRDGGYIDRVDDADGSVVDKDADWSRTSVVRAALAFKPTEGLLITPSLFYQRQFDNNRSQYWESFSDVGGEDFKSGNPLPEKYHDKFYLPAVKVQYQNDVFELNSNTSYFNRKSTILLDYTTFLRALFTGDPLTPIDGTIPSGAFVTTKQENFTQEVRLQSPASSRVEWILGAFFTRQRQRSINLTDSNEVGGTAANGYNYTNHTSSTDRQIAGFANIAYPLTEQLKVSAGVRVAELKFSYLSLGDGPVNGGPSSDSGKTSETPVTPKFGVSYQIDRDNLLYANVAKGFRQGGAQAPVPASFCAADLASLGLTAGPSTYKADTVWSYDAGAKNSLFGGRLNIDASAYFINWDNIQQSVRLANCGFSFIGNLGKARSRGVDLTFDTRVSDAVRLGGNIGFNKTTFNDDVLGGGGVLLAGKGDGIGGPQFTGAVWGQVDFPIGPYRSYFRSDLTFRTKGVSPDPHTFSYDADLTATRPAYVVSARLGVFIKDVEASVFVNNLFNENAALFRTHDVAGSPLFYAGGYRPRTVGMTATYKY